MKINKKSLIKNLLLSLVAVFCLGFAQNIKASASSTYWKNYFSTEERKAVQKNADRYTRKQIEKKSKNWKGIIRGYNIKNGSITGDDIKDNEIGLDKIKGLDDYLGQMISSGTTDQDFLADKLTGNYAGLNGSAITNLSPASITESGNLNINGAIDATDITSTRENLGLAYATQTDLNYYNIAMWGDSLTVGMTSILADMIPTYSVYNGGIGGEISTQIKTRMIADTDKYDFITVIWAGNNNATDITTVKEDIATMVSNLVDTKQYIIIGMSINSAYPSGTGTYTTIKQLNSDLEVLYPNNYIDIHDYLVNEALSDAGIAPTAQDIADIANDVVPDSLRNDAIHLNTDGYTQVSQQVIDFVNANYLPTTDRIVSYRDLEDIFLNPAPMEKLTVFGNIEMSEESQLLLNDRIFIQADTSLFNFFSGGAGITESSVTGTRNTGFGHLSLKSINSGSYNVAFGYGSINAGTSGSKNVSIGYNTLNKNTIGSNNVAIGFNALNKNTTSFNNVAVGYQSLLNNTGSANTTIGYNSLFTNISGYSNTAAGGIALFSNTTGYNNSAVGLTSLYNNTEGHSNTAFGVNSLFSNTTGTGNTVMGFLAGRYITGGSVENTTGDYNVFIGYNTKALADNDQNEIVIGYNAIGIGSNSVTLGSDAITTTALKGSVGIGTTTPAVALDVNGQVKMKKESAEPFACDVTHDATMAITSGYRTCICNGTSDTWVFTSDGTTTCTW